MRTEYAGENEHPDALPVGKFCVRVRNEVSSVVVHTAFTGIFSFDRGCFSIAIKFEPDVHVPITTGTSIALIIKWAGRYWSSGNGL
jgi:hypothetical protein